MTDDKKRLVLFACVSTLFCLPAWAQETWVCAYTWSSPDKTVIHRRFQVNGDDLIDNSIASPERFRILQNNYFGIVAAYSFAELEFNEPAIGAFVVLIDKQNGKFQLSNATLGEPQAATGTCTK
jgi:hypothetical protein